MTRALLLNSDTDGNSVLRLNINRSVLPSLILYPTIASGVNTSLSYLFE